MSQESCCILQYIANYIKDFCFLLSHVDFYTTELIYLLNRYNKIIRFLKYNN